MRDYAKVTPHFWTGSTGKQLRQCPEAMMVAMYLMTSPHANMLGLYYIPILYIAHETGLGIEGASKGLASAESAGFCSYDPDSEMVWVHEMARFQIADELKATDNRCKGIQSEYNSLPSNPYLEGFYAKYKKAFCMTKRRENSSKKTSPFEAPTKPLASQEQEQEQEQDNIHTQGEPEKNSLDEILNLWNPDLHSVNSWFVKAGLSQFSQNQLDQIKPEFLSYYADQLKSGLLKPDKLFGKLVAWVKRDYKTGDKSKSSKSTGYDSSNVNAAWQQQQEPVKYNEAKLPELTEADLEEWQ